MLNGAELFWLKPCALQCEAPHQLSARDHAQCVSRHGSRLVWGTQHVPPCDRLLLGDRPGQAPLCLLRQRRCLLGDPWGPEFRPEKPDPLSLCLASSSHPLTVCFTSQAQRDIIFELRRIAFDAESDPSNAPGSGTEKRKAMYTKDYKMLGFTVSFPQHGHW